MASVKSKPHALSSIVPALAKVARTGHPFCGYCRRNQNPGPPADATINWRRNEHRNSRLRPAGPTPETTRTDRFGHGGEVVEPLAGNARGTGPLAAGETPGDGRQDPARPLST